MGRGEVDVAQYFALFGSLVDEVVAFSSGGHSPSDTVILFFLSFFVPAVE